MSDSLPSFFVRNGLCETDLVSILSLATSLRPGDTFEPLETQGYCSYTLLASGPLELATGHDAKSIAGSRDVVLQFRLAQHALSTTVVGAAVRVYGSLVPETVWRGSLTCVNGLDLEVCEMSRIAGVPYSTLQPNIHTLDEPTMRKQLRLVLGLASFLALAWPSNPVEGLQRGARRCDGKVGSSMVRRLEQLHAELPCERLRSLARNVLAKVGAGRLKILPVVTTHGDLIPSNVMVDHHTWQLAGCVDWAEAENLPFGMCLYGLEHMLGYLRFDAVGTSFQYYTEAEQLRYAFWSALLDRVPQLRSLQAKRAVLLARDVGVLLWYGIAWDEGKIDRVVNRRDDPTDLVYLNAFTSHRINIKESRL